MGKFCVKWDLPMAPPIPITALYNFNRPCSDDEMCLIILQMSTPVEKLHIAIRENDLNKVSDMQSSGVDINGIYYGMTPLLVAISTGKGIMIIHAL